MAWRLAEQGLALSSLRVYAVCDKSKTLAAAVFALSAIPIGTNAVRCRELVHIVCIKIDFNSVISLHSMTIGVLQVTRRSVLLSHALRRISSVKITPSLSKNRIHIIIKIAPFITFAGIQV